MFPPAGQPYAFKQAGMVTGILLLVSLTVVVRYSGSRIPSIRLTRGIGGLDDSVQSISPALLALSVAYMLHLSLLSSNS
jgi:hypothetical protein